MAKGGQSPKENLPSPALKAAWERREAGDVAGARAEVLRLLASGPLPPQEESFARDLLARTATPLALYSYAALSAAILALLVILAAVRY